MVVKMETGTDSIIKGDSSANNSNSQSDPVTDVKEILRKAGFEEDSDAEYLSAEEDTDSELADSAEKLDIQKEGAHRSDEDSPFKQRNIKYEDKDSFHDGDEEEDTAKADQLAIRQQEEDLLTPEEKEERKDKGQNLKADGNAKFRDGDYNEAIEAYSEALDICPLIFHKERAIMFANRAACKMKKEEYQEAVDDSTHAIDLHPHYLKAILRRAELFEKTEKFDEALKDYEKVVELDPSQHAARAACIRLAEQIKERNEKMKEEMIGKLKDLGNLVLRPFGLNVNNFNLQQDPNSGSYSVQFRQNPSGNGS